MLKFIRNLFKARKLQCNIPVGMYATPEEILTGRQIQEAEIWYYKHRNHVNSLVNDKAKFPPTTQEDKNEPSLWKPEHWNWFLAYYH